MAVHNNDHLPIIHLNGTAKEALVGMYADAVDALHAAGDRLKLTAPNGRDFYSEPGRMDKAERVFRERMTVLRKLIEEVEADMLGIDRL